MRKVLILFFFLGFLIQSYASDKPEYAVANISKELLEDANSVVRYEHEIYTLEALDKYTTEITKVVTIFNKNSRDQGLPVLYDKMRKVDEIGARLYDSEGNEIKKFKKNEIQDFSAHENSYQYDDSRYKYIDLSHNVYPYTIELHYKTTSKTLHTRFLFVANNVGRSYEEISLEMRVKTGLEIKYLNENTDLEPTIKDLKEYKVYRWELSDVEAHTSERYAPNENPLGKVHITSKDFKIDQYVGSFNSWEDYGLFLYDLNKDRNSVSPELEKKILEITASASTDKEKIEIIYDYLKANTRYVSVQLGIGGWQTFDANYVETKQYGDCKALTNFMVSLLKIAGIDSYSGCIYSGSSSPQYDDSFAIANFNHVICYIPAEDLWIECTSRDYPLGYLGSNNDDRKILLYTKEGGQFVNTPAYPNEENNTKATYNIEILISGGAKISAKKEYNGFEHESLRHWYFQRTKSDYKEAFQEGFPLTILDLKKLELKAEEDAPKATVEYDVVIPRYGSKAGKRIFLPVNPFHLNFYKLPEYENRKLDVFNEKGSYYFEKLIIQIPEGYQIETSPDEEKIIDNVFGKYTLHIQKEGSKLIIDRSFHMKDFHEPPEKYEELRSFIKEVDKCDNAKLVLVQKKT